MSTFAGKIGHDSSLSHSKFPPLPSIQTPIYKCLEFGPQPSLLLRTPSNLDPYSTKRKIMHSQLQKSILQ